MRLLSRPHDAGVLPRGDRTGVEHQYAAAHHFDRERILGADIDEPLRSANRVSSDHHALEDGWVSSIDAAIHGTRPGRLRRRCK